MSRKDCRKMQVLSRVKDGLITVVEAAKLLKLSYRQTKRLWKRYRNGGAKAILHRARGRSSNNHLDPELKTRVVDLYREKYLGFGPTLAVEKLTEEDQLPVISRETLRLWLLEAGLWQRHRRHRPYRKRREPRHCFGELVQLDGSHHPWFGDERGFSCLMNMVDDATGTTLAIMFEEETTEAAMRVLWAWIEKYGVPLALYCDLKSVYLSGREPTVEEQLAGVTPKTAFGRACEKLGIQIISAYSPQAKGRVERNHGVYQDRFVKELRLRGATTVAEANMILKGGFSDKLNAKFSRPPLDVEDRHVALGGAEDLREVFCFEETRSVSHDWVVRNDNHFYQLSRGKEGMPRAGSKITVRTWLDGSAHILHKGRRLPFKELDAQVQMRRKVG